MADTRIGKIGLTPKGAWVSTDSYEILDVVLSAVEDGGDGCSYTALKPSQGVRPGTDSTIWLKSSQAGQSIYDLAVKYHHFEGTEEEFEAEYQAALQAARDAAAGASAVESQVEEAEAARVAAENARVSAEAERANAETARQTAETSRATAETARQSAESNRGSAETTRQSAETTRESAETTRQSNESARASAELTRTQQFQALKTDMQTAIQNVDAKAAEIAEDIEGYEQNEAGRVSAEQGRVAAETARAQQSASDHTRAESDHTTATSDHQQAGSDHTRAEADHTTASEDHTTAASDHSTAGTDHTRAEQDHTTAESDHGTAESDHTRAESDHAIVQGYDTRLTNVEGEVSQLGQEVDKKLDRELADSALYITDANGAIIAQIDADGVSTVDVKVKVDGELVSVKSLLSTLSGNIASEQVRAEAEEAKKLDAVLSDNRLIITDAAGYIIFRVDANGAHSAQDKHAVACMVLSEYYYPTATPTRDMSGNITHAEIMYGTGVNGSVDITYSGGNATQVTAVYGPYTYTISIQRDASGNVEKVTVI